MKIVRCNRCRQDIPTEAGHGVLRHGNTNLVIYSQSSMPNNSRHLDLCTSCDADFIAFLGNNDVPAAIDFRVQS